MCTCGHDIKWEHYKRIPGNGQQFDWVCINCLADLLLARSTRNPYHFPLE